VSLSIRRARDDELAACADLYDRVVKATFTWLDPPDQHAKFFKEAEDEEVYVAVEDGRILGLAAFFRPTEFLHSMYVDTDAHGRGVGSALLAHVTATAKGPITLKVVARNTPARRFWKARGFAEIEHGEDEPGHPWVRMQR